MMMATATTMMVMKMKMVMAIGGWRLVWCGGWDGICAQTVDGHSR